MTNQKFNNCLNNKEEANKTTWENFVEKVTNIASALEKENKYYARNSEGILFDTLDVEPVSCVSTEAPVDLNDDTNYCDNCTGTTLQDCLKCKNGSENPNKVKDLENVNDDKDQTEESTNQIIKELEQKLRDIIKVSKTEKLERVYDMISDELVKRYADGIGLVDDKFIHIHDHNCENNCSHNCKSSTPEKNVKCELYICADEKETPEKVNLELTQKEFEDIQKIINNTMHSEIQNIIEKFKWNW